MWHLGDDAEIARLTSIVLLGYRTGLSPGEADSRTLLNLLAIKRELAERGLAPTSRGPVPRRRQRRPGPADRARRLRDQRRDREPADRPGSPTSPTRRSVLLRLYSGDGSAIRLVDPAVLGR